MKECSSRKLLIVRMSWDDPHPTSQKKLPDGQQEQGHEIVHHDQGKGYQQSKSFRSGSG